jgi:hypothetical protein
MVDVWHIKFFTTRSRIITLRPLDGHGNTLKGRSQVLRLPLLTAMNLALLRSDTMAV